MRLGILGSTGSIGRQAIDVVRNSADIEITVLAALHNIDLMYDEIIEFKPHICCMYDEEKAAELRIRLAKENIPTEVFSGMEGLHKCATYTKMDMVLISIVGMIAIRPTIWAISAGKDIAQANKESIVCAGHIIMPLIKEKNVRLIPVDSEHSAIYQCLEGERENPIHKIWLTASGGPFFGKKRAELENVTLADALKHPSWSMGTKITIDSATLVNKGLEVIEAHYLFDTPAENIEVVVNPGSKVHSMVEFEDGAIKAELGTADMRLPISYALNYKSRVRLKETTRLSIEDLSKLQFFPPDIETFGALKLAMDICRNPGTNATVFNAANEECVGLFREGKIGFLDIETGISKALKAHTNRLNPDLDEIFKVEKETRKFIREYFNA